MSNTLHSSKKAMHEGSDKKPKGVFAHFPDYIRDSLIADKQTFKFKAGEQVINRNTEEYGVWYLMKGHVRVGRLLQEGDLHVMLVISQGDSFGDITCFSGSGKPVDGIAVDDVEAYWISKLEIHDMVSKFPEMNRLVQSVLGQQLLQALDIIIMTRYQDSSAKLMWNLKYFCSHKKPPIPLPMSQADLADMVGVSRMTISKELKILEDQGILERSYGQMFIIKPEELL